MEKICIIELQDKEKKFAYTGEILEKLPEWFGNKEARENYAKEAKDLPFWVAVNEEEKCVGFFAIERHYEHTGEIYVCGVLPEYQQQGIGKALYNAVEEYLTKNDCKYIMVKTLSDKVDFEPYAKTRAFYENVGFEPLLTLTEMWDEENSCLIMIKSLGR